MGSRCVGFSSCSTGLSSCVLGLGDINYHVPILVAVYFKHLGRKWSTNKNDQCFSLVAVHGFLIVVTSLVAEHGSRVGRLH